jgi:carboxymethylenebutenolidase
MTTYASAAGAPAATTIETSAEGLEARALTIDTPRGALPLYYARPEGGTDLPIVLVAQEIFGLHDHIRDIVRRFAKEGYLAVAPDYFAHVGDPLSAPDIDAVRAIVARTPDWTTLADFDSARAFAAETGGDASRCAITGFCWGGRVAWLYAAQCPALSACIPWYGRLDGPHSETQPRWPIDVAAELRVPTLGLYGGADASIPLDLVAAMRAKLKAPSEILVYDDAPHAFFADYRESYRAAAAQDAFARALAFLRARL